MAIEDSPVWFGFSLAMAGALLFQFLCSIVGVNIPSYFSVAPRTFGSALTSFFEQSVVFIGISQFIYLTPLFVWMRRSRKPDTFETLKGLVLGAIVVILLNGVCFVAFWDYLAPEPW